ncbi:MAG: hypothetical protein ACRC4W_09260 [Treponemataceae bacterium]
MFKIIVVIYMLFSSSFFASDLYWEGKALSNTELDFPNPTVLAKPVFPVAKYTAYSNKFKKGDIVHLQHLENKKEIIVEIIGSHKLGAILVVVSPAAAKDLGLKDVSKMSEQDFFQNESLNLIQARKKRSCDQ